MRKGIEIATLTLALSFGLGSQGKSEQLPSQVAACSSGAVETRLPLKATDSTAPAVSLSDLIEQYTTEFIRQGMDRPGHPTLSAS
jgi:hypothetical protein